MSAGSLSVLIVEDDAEACDTLCNLIGMAYPSLVIHAADNGRSALECFTRHSPDMIITDLQMPVMDGISIAAAMKSLNPDVVIVALTCCSDEKSLLRCIEIGIDHYLLKPLVCEKLCAVIDKHIELKSAICQRRQSEEALRGSEERYRKLVEQMRDGLERKAAEQEILKSHELLRHLAAHMETAREDERLRISREVHDELGQLLTALKFDIVSLRKNDSFSAALAAKLAGMEETVSATIGSVQRIVGQLRPRLLDDLGIQAAIEWQADEFAKRTGISCRLELCEFPELSPDCSITVIRILQEALTNIVRHAEATKVTIKLVREAAFLVFSIADNGKGASDHALLASDSFGLMGMRERAILCRGTFDIGSTPGQGVSIRLQIPLHKSEEC